MLFARRLSRRLSVSLFPPRDSPHWLQWRQVSVGAACIVLVAALLTITLVDRVDSHNVSIPAPVVNPDYAAAPPPLPTPSDFAEYDVDPDDEQEVDWDHYDELSFDSTKRDDNRLGNPDNDGFLWPRFDLQDWYQHIRVTDIVLPQIYLHCRSIDGQRPSMDIGEFVRPPLS